jgi:hypothetical protein
MRKWVKIALCCLLVLVETVGFSLVFGAVLSHDSSGGGVDPYAHDSVLPVVQGVARSNGFYDVQLAFINVTYNEQLENILINPHSSEEVAGLIAYLNGTALAAGAPITCSLASGDGVQINLTFPCSEFDSGSTVELCVMGDCFLCGKSVVLP